MIERLQVQHFKSIKSLDLQCKRINVFLGKPNTGKSNLLESLGLLAHFKNEGKIKDLVRFEDFSQLYYNQDLGKDIIVQIDGRQLTIHFLDGRHRGRLNTDNKEVFAYEENGSGSITSIENFKNIKFYRFRTHDVYPALTSECLNAPFGSNLLALLRVNVELSDIVGSLFEEYGLRLGLRPHDKKIELRKERGYITISFPFSIASDTLQRLVFFIAAVNTNKDAVLIFEEPESHAFPYYTKYLAERIALDENKNQYFIATHNPYLLLSILEKARVGDVAVHITHFKDDQTKVKTLDEKGIKKIMDLESDVFFNIEELVS